MHVSKIIIAIFVLLYGVVLSAKEPSWVGLYPADFNKIFPKVGKWRIELYKLPTSKSEKLGFIDVEFVNEEGFKFTYIPISNLKKKIIFTPDLFEADWGYGPYYHQTVLATKDKWVLLPKKPLEKEAWVNLTLVFGKNDFRTLEKGMVYKLDDRSIYLIEVNENSITIRDEQEADMLGGEENPPVIKKFSPETIEFRKLYDENKHLRIKPKYTKGC